MTIMQLIESCIATLGKVKPSIEDIESVGIPVKQVRDQQIALHEFLKNKEQEAAEKEQKTEDAKE